MRAYILLKAGPLGATRAMEGLRDTPHVIEAAVIHGPYDCLAEIEAPNVSAINDTVFTIRDIPGVADTLTCLVVRSWQRPLG